MQQEIYRTDQRILQNPLQRAPTGHFKHGKRNYSFAQHLIENGHEAGPIEDIMSTVYITNKGRLMGTLQKYYIFRETKMDNQINDEVTARLNIIFETVVQKDPHRGIRNFHHMGLNAPHPSRTQAISVKTTSAQLLQRSTTYSPPYTDVNHDASSHIEATTRRPIEPADIRK
jgi:hypothetical protein